MTNRRRNAVSTKIIFQLLLIVVTIFSFTTAFSQTEQSKDIRIVVFNDGTIVKGQVVQMNIDTITIWTPYDDIIVRKYADVENLVKEDIAPSRSSPQVDRTPSYRK